MISRTLVAFTMAVAWATPALAQSKVEVSAAAKDVVVGADIEVAVTVKNAGEAEVELPKLAFDARSVSFEISVDGGRPAWDTRFNTNPTTNQFEPDPLKPLEKGKLKAGESWTETFKIPAIASGTWAVTTIYAGTSKEVRTLGGLSDPNALTKLRAAPLSVKVAPGPNGEVEVVARMATTMGTMTWRFFPKDALGSALNFVRIAKSGFYDGKNFHRVDTDLGVVQGGATKDNGQGHFDWSIPLEQNLKHRPMFVGMARSEDPNSGSSQFYIVTTDAASVLDRPNGYAIFAQVVRGKDVVDTLASVKTVGGIGQGMAGQQPASRLAIESVKVQLAPKS